MFIVTFCIGGLNLRVHHEDLRLTQNLLIHQTPTFVLSLLRHAQEPRAVSRLPMCQSCE